MAAQPAAADRFVLLARRLAVALQPPPEALLRAQGPLQWPSVLYAYQRDGVRALLHSEHLLLGDEMGLGKGVQAIAALRLLLHRREIERALVVVPASLLDQWRGELALWAPELRIMAVRGSSEERLWQWQYRAHVTLTSYETLRADALSGASSGPLREEWGVVVLDEAQRIRNPSTELARACARLPRVRSWALSGTPLENRVEDIVSILGWVRGASVPRSLSLAAKSEPALRAALGELQLRRRKAEVLDQLPPKTQTRLLLPLSPAQRLAYDQAAGEGTAALSEARPSPSPAPMEHVLALLSRLKQICNFDPASGASSKADDLAARLEEIAASNHKALIFTQYTGESGAARLAKRLERFEPLQYTGSMSLGQRDRVLELFRRDPSRRVLILSLQAGGQGLNLQGASYVFHFDRWWNPATEEQAEARAHRLGQASPVQVYSYVSAHTIEERVDEILARKSQDFARLVDASSLDLSQLLGPDHWRALASLPPSLAQDTAQEEASDNAQSESAQSELAGVALEKRVARLLERQGYRVETTGDAAFGAGRDGGVDLVAHKSDEVGARVRLFVQCKDWSRPLGVEAVRALNGVLPSNQRGAQGIVACPGGFTREAQSFALARGIQLWDASRLAHLENEAGS